MRRTEDTVWSMHPRLRAVSTHLFSLLLRTTGYRLLRFLLWRKLWQWLLLEWVKSKWTTWKLLRIKNKRHNSIKLLSFSLRINMILIMMYSLEVWLWFCLLFLSLGLFFLILWNKSVYNCCCLWKSLMLRIQIIARYFHRKIEFYYLYSENVKVRLQKHCILFSLLEYSTEF